MLDSSGYEDGKILVFAKLGKQLKEIDEKRILAIAQDNPNKYLFNIYENEITILLEKLENIDDDNVKEFKKQILKDLLRHNETDNIFYELNKFLTKSDDMLSIGSFLTGHDNRKHKLAKIISEDD